MAFKLHTFVSKEIAELARDLQGQIDELRNAFASRSAEWRGTDEAFDVEVWIERLRHLADDLEKITDKPESDQ